jgi:hypothetical protein
VGVGWGWGTEEETNKTEEEGAGVTKQDGEEAAGERWVPSDGVRDHGVYLLCSVWGATGGRHMEGRPAFVVLSVDVCALLHQETDYIYRVVDACLQDKAG